MGTTVSAPEAPPPAPAVLSFEAFSGLGAGKTDEGGAAPAQPVTPAAHAPSGTMSFDDFSAIKEPKEADKTVPPGAPTGYVANVGAGTSEGVSGLLGLPVDLTTRVLNLGPRAINAVAGTEIPQIQNPVGGAHWWNQVFGVVGANPEQVVPATTGEELARAGARGVTSVALPGGVARLLPEAAAGSAALTTQRTIASGTSPTMVAAAGGGAAAGQAVADQVPQEWKEVADTATQLLVGGSIVGASAATRGTARAGGSAVRAVLPGKPEPVLNPATGEQFTAQPTTAFTHDPTTGEITPPPGDPITASPYQQRAAGRLIARAGGGEPGEVTSAVPAEPLPGPGESTGTLGQQTGNLGLIAKERALENTPYGRTAFQGKRAVDNLTRVQSLKDAAPGDVSSAAGEWMAAQLAREKALEATEVEAAKASAGTATEAAGIGPGGPGVQEMGAAQREALEAVRGPIKAAAGRAYDAIDPDGTLALDTSPVAAAARTIREGLGKGGKLSAAETDVLDAARDMGGVNKFSDLRSLQSNLAEALREVRRDPRYGAESQPYRRLSQLMDSVHRSMTEAASRAAERDVASGTPVGQRFVDRAAEVTGGGRAPAGGAGGDLGADAAAGGADGAAGSPGAGAAGVGPGVGPGVHPGDRGVAAAPAAEPAGVTAPRKPESLVDFLISKNGIKPNGETRAMNLETLHHRQGGGLISARGLEHDYAREAAVEQGFLKPGDDINALYDKLSQHPTYRPEDEAVAADYEAHRAEASRREHSEGLARSAVLRAEMDEGARLTQGAVDHAIRMLVDDPNMHPSEAIRQAAFVDDERALQRNANASALDLRPGVSPLARQAEAQLPGGATMFENFKPEDTTAIRAANRYYGYYKQTFRSGAVGDVLRSGPGEGGYKLGDSAVPGKLFRSGPAGAEAADGLIKAHGSVEAAQAALGDYPAMQLRNKAMSSGSWNDRAYEQFKNAYAPALAKFPALARRFETAAEAQRQVDAAAARGRARVDEFENSAAKVYLTKEGGAADNMTAIDRLMKQENTRVAARDLMARAAPNDAATAGIQRNILEWLAQRSTTTAEAGVSGVKDMSGAVYQRLVNNPKIAAVLDEVLSPAQLKVVRNNAADLARAARAWNAVKVPGSPGTAADLAAAHGHGGVSQFLAAYIGEKAGGVAEKLLHVVGGGFLTGDFTGAVGGLLLAARRAAGLESIERLMIEGQLNPQLGRVLEQAAASNPRAPLWRQTAQRILTLGAGVSTQDAARR